MTFYQNLQIDSLSIHECEFELICPQTTGIYWIIIYRNSILSHSKGISLVHVLWKYMNNCIINYAKIMYTHLFPNKSYTYSSFFEFRFIYILLPSIQLLSSVQFCILFISAWCTTLQWKPNGIFEYKDKKHWIVKKDHNKQNDHDKGHNKMSWFIAHFKYNGNCICVLHRIK